MIWQNPWAWLGLAGIALPIVIHLLGRGHARVVRFPTLRFIDASRLLPTRRSRIQDPLLLAVRVAIVALAALALAQPLWMTGGRRQALDRGLARAVIVDTSASARRVSLDSARSLATRLAGNAQMSIVIATNDPSTALRGAAAWVAKQQRRGEIAIVSDFQAGQLDRADLASIPASMGIMLRRVAMPANTDSSVTQLASNGRTLTATASVSAAGVDAAWAAGSVTSSRSSVTLLGGRDDADALAALQTAAATVAVPLPIDTTRAIAIVFARYAGRDSLVRNLEAARQPWQLELLDDVRGLGLPLAASGNAVVGGTDRFVLVTTAGPSSFDAARLLSAAHQATSSAPAPSELEPGVVSDGELRTWERAPTDVASTQFRPTDGNGPSDARWLWTIVLGLLLIEWWMRRTTTAATTTTEEHARAA